MNIQKNAIKRWSLRTCTRVSRFLNWARYFYWLGVKNSNHPNTESSLCYLNHTKFYLENKASFIQISGIASFRPFLIAWLWEYCICSDSSVVSLKSSPWSKYTQEQNYFPKKSHVLPSNFLFFFKYLFFIRLFLQITFAL